jgi:hypothetical protein
VVTRETVKHPVRAPRPKGLLIASLVAACAVACASAGPYGYSKQYEPHESEEEALAGAQDYDPVMVGRSPEKWRGVKVSAFGVVSSRQEGPFGNADLTLSVRTLEPRNLCESTDEATCRVTVGEREHAVIHAWVPLRSEDMVGEKSVGVGSLLRVVGTMADEVSRTDGHQTIKASYYRHWPRNHFVTTAARSYMLR